MTTETLPTAALANENDFEGEEEVPKSIATCDGDHLAARTAETSWLWRPWVPQGHLSVLAGAPGVGKSTVALSLAASIITDTAWPDGADHDRFAGPVLVCDSEGAQALWVNRFRAWGLPGDRLLFPGPDGFGRVMLDDLATVQGVGELVRQHDIPLVIVDSLRTALAGSVDENSSGIASILTPWAELARDLSIAVLLVHHFGKVKKGETSEATIDRVRGSSAIAAAVRSILAIDRPDPEAPEARLLCIKSNLAELPRPLGFTISEEGVCWTDHAPKAPRRDSAVGRAEEFLQAVLQTKPVRWGDLQAEAGENGISKDSLYRAGKKLGVVQVPDPADHTGKGRLWSLPAVTTGRDRSGWG